MTPKVNPQEAERLFGDLFDEPFLARLEALGVLAKRLAGRPGGVTHTGRELGDGMDFADHRSYTPGDDIRYVDWPYFARMEKLLLRLFHRHSESDVAILLDISASMGSEASASVFVSSLRLVASLGYIAAVAGANLIIQPFAHRMLGPLRLGRGREQLFPLLQYLANLRASGKTHVEPCIERFMLENPRPGTMILISDLLDSENELSAGLARLQAGGWTTAVLQVYSPEMETPQLGGAIQLLDAETGQSMELRADEEMRKAYQRGWEQFCEDIEMCCRKQNTIHASIRSDWPTEDVVLKVLRRVGVLRE